jgi:signal transduction histidine kinase
VKNLLDLSRIEAGALVLDLARVDLRELIQSQIGEMSALTATSGVRLRGDLPDQPVEAVVDADRLTQARHQSALERPALRAK